MPRKGWVAVIGDELDRDKYKISPKYVFSCYQCSKCETTPITIDPTDEACPFYDIPKGITQILDVAYSCNANQKRISLGNSPSISCTNGNRRGVTHNHCGECANCGKEVLVSKYADTTSLGNRGMIVKQPLYYCKKLSKDTLVTKNYSCESFEPKKKG